MTELQKYFTTKAKGGYSNCIDRGSGSVLPNCVGFAWSCFFLLHSSKDFSKRPSGDAYMIYDKCKAKGSGFIVAKAVKENAICCFGISSKHTKGHVTYIFYKLPNGYYIVGESGYSGTISNGMYLKVRLTKTPEKLYDNYQGCVYDFYP